MTERHSRRRPVAGPQLGQTTFDEWYETPVFEMDPDERLEQLATSRRAPMRVVGAAALSLRARRHPRDPFTPQSSAEDPEPTVVDLRDGFRRRLGGLLDRWAEAELAGQARLEDIMLPRRWRD